MKEILFLGLLIAIVVGCRNSVSNPSFKNVSVTELGKLKVDYPNLKIIDLRTPTEISNGKIDENAMEINFFDDDFESQLQKLDLDQSYLIYCKSGGRSGKTFSLMEKLGFKEVFHLDGGYKAWSSSKR